jgi:hypothetical protein
MRRAGGRSKVETCIYESETTFVAVTMIRGKTNKADFRRDNREIPRGGAVPITGLGDAAMAITKLGCIAILADGQSFNVCARRDGRPVESREIRPLAEAAYDALSRKQ